MPMSVVRVLARFNAPRWWFGGRYGAFHEGMKHFSKNSLLSTYKRRLPPYLNINQQKRNNVTRREELYSYLSFLASPNVGSE
jgi:hypothetical protein